MSSTASLRRLVLFQFHKGAIRTLGTRNGLISSDAMFQFHKGAIRTIGDQVVYRAERKFQFHKGAIRTRKDWELKIYHYGFNSIKVQLELLLRFLALWVLMFQFHKGAIRTSCTTTMTADNQCFNSIKVQLEHYEFTQPIGILSWFQFLKGAIRTQFQKLKGRS